MTTTKKIDEEIDLDDGPVLTSDRVWPAALPQTGRKGPPPPPPSRRARGTAPLGEPLPSGLIDVRAMAAAYAAELPAVAEPAPALAEGTSPLALVALEPAPPRAPLPARPSRRRVAVAVVAIGGALAAAAVFAGSLLLRGDRPDAAPARAHAPAPPLTLVEAPPLVLRADEAPPEVRVIPLPTTITEIAPPRVRRPAGEPRLAVRVDAAAGSLPVRPSNSEISSAVVAAKKRLDSCGAQHQVSGAVPVAIKVSASGAVASVAVETGSADFRTCVASALKRQRLPASQVGATARFPVLFR